MSAKDMYYDAARGGWFSRSFEAAVAAAANQIPAPAVPVGVQPEPAEEREALEYAADLDERLRKSREADEFETRIHGRVKGLSFAPAVPVVHPEPGDRAERMHWFLAGHHDADRRPSNDEIVRQVEIEVVAAVAAVRADLAAKIEEDRYVEDDATRERAAEHFMAIVRGRGRS